MEFGIGNPRLIWSQRIGLLGFLLCLAGMPISPALLSIGAVTMLIPGFFAYAPKEQLKRFYQDKAAFFLSLVFVVQIAAYFWTDDKEQFFQHLRIKAPFFFGLYSLTVLGPFPRKWIRIGLMLFVLSTFITGSLTVFDYFQHKEQYDLEIQVSKPLPIFFDINHIYFSLVMAVSVFAGIWGFRQKVPVFHRYERYVLLFMAVAEAGYLHILTARTGLVAFYVAVFLVMMGFIFVRRKYILGAVLLLGFFSAPVIGYMYVPSLQHRVENTRMDLEKYFRGDDPNHLSIGTRFESWKAAWGLIKAHPVGGVGMADLKEEMYDQYVRDGSMLCDNNYVLPHNEFIQLGAGLGILGLLTFSIGWFYPVFNRPMSQNWLFWTFWVIMSFGMLGESVVERQLGNLMIVVMWMGLRWLGPDVHELSRSNS